VPGLCACFTYAHRVVTQFLDYARPYKGEAAEIDANEVVRKTAALLENQDAAPGIKLELRLADGLPRIRGDAEQLRQVFLNLGLTTTGSISRLGTG
jgi:signal transduction histidine kinase